MRPHSNACPGMSLDEIRRRVRNSDQGAGESSAPPGKQPELIGDILRRMQDRGELPRAKGK